MVDIHVCLCSLSDLMTSQGLHNLCQFTNTSIVGVELVMVDRKHHQTRREVFLGVQMPASSLYGLR